MRFQIHSDLHSEFARFDSAPSDADVVILAGDIDLKSRGVKWGQRDIPVSGDLRVRES